MTSYYASPGGSDGNAGTSTGTAVQTLSRLIALCTTNGDIGNMMVGAYAWLDTSAVRTGITLQNYQTDAVTISRAHGGTWATNAGSVIQFTGACTNCKIRRNPLGGSITIKHTGTPSAAGAPAGSGYLAVGNAHLSYSGIRVLNGSGWRFEDLIVQDIFGYGINVNSAAGSHVTRCEIFNTASGVWFNDDSVVIEDNDIHDNGYMLRSGTEEDTGANGIQVSGATNWTIVNNDLHGNWSRTGSQQFGAEGGAIEYFNIPTGGGGSTVGNRAWDNHGFIEGGCNQTNSSGGGPNAELGWNIIYGKNDYQDVTAGLVQAAGGNSAAGNPNGTTPWFNIRAVRDTNIHHNVWDVTHGAPSNSGLRTTSGGTFGGETSGNTVEDNAFRVRAHPIDGSGTPVYNFNSGPPPGWTIRNNIIYYTFSYTGNVVASVGTVDDYTIAEGPAAMVAGMGLGQNDIWGDSAGHGQGTAANPDFVDATNANLLLRDYHLLAGSPAIGAAHDGTDIGALAFVGTIAAALAGTIAGTSSATSALTTAIQLAGTIAGTSSGVLISTETTLAGTISAVSSALLLVTVSPPAPTPTAPRPVLTLAQVFAGSHTPCARLLALNVDGSVRYTWEGPSAVLVSGTVTFDRTREVRRTGSVELYTTGSLTPHRQGDPLFPGARIRLERGADLGGGQRVYMTLATLVVASYDASMRGRLQVTGEDPLSLLAQPLGDVVSVDAGMTAEEALAALWEPVLGPLVGPASGWSLNGAGALVPARSWAEEDDRLSAGVSLMADLGLEVFADRLGNVVLRPIRDPTTQQPVRAFTTAPGSASMIDLDRSGSQQPKNKSVAISDNLDTEPFRAEAEVTDLSSPVHRDRIGLQVAPYYHSAQLPDQAAANAVAQARLIEFALYQDAVGGAAIPDPTLDEGDVATFAEAVSGADSNYRLDSITHPVLQGGMTFTATKILPLFVAVQSPDARLSSAAA